jgi:hypothetical protein
MKIAVISTNKLSLKLKNYKIHGFLWSDIGKKEINLRDFDGVILDLSGLDEKASGVNWPEFQEILNFEITLDVLYREGSFIYVIGNPFTNGHQYSVAEMLGLKLKYVPGKGDSITKTKSFKNSPFKDYLQKVKSYSYSFSAQSVTAEVVDRVERFSRHADVTSTSYLGNRSGYTIAAEIGINIFELTYNNYRTDENPLFAGKLVILPAIDMELDGLTNMLLEVSSENSAESEPEWAGTIIVNGQPEVDALLIQNDEAAQKLNSEKKDLVQQKEVLRKSVEVLYKSGKPLEESIKFTLTDMGLQIIEPQTSDKVEFYITFKEFKFVVEVKSTANETIDQKGLRQVIDWQNDAFDETGDDYKALVITSTQFDKPLDDRTEDILPHNLQEYAEKRNIAVLTVKDMFNVSQMVQRGEITLDDFIKELASFDGLYKITKEPKQL